MATGCPPAFACTSAAEGRAYAEDDLLPLSALQHLGFCERQCALIHVEGVWADNARTPGARTCTERPTRVPANPAATSVSRVRGLNTSPAPRRRSAR